MPTKALSGEFDHEIAVLRIADGKADDLSHVVIEELQSLFARAQTEEGFVQLASCTGRFSTGFKP
ncbi:MAG: hypothetical protein GY725_13330 [bacterium]|nr:hypothetical protein [bacterium]